MPNVAPKLDTKNLTILEDQLNHEMLAYRKSEMYAQSMLDPQLKSMAGTIALNHRARFDQLLSYMNSHQ